METLKTPAERMARKAELIKKILVVEFQINNNQRDGELLSKLREDFRRYHDELSTYYDDVKEENIHIICPQCAALWPAGHTACDICSWPLVQERVDYGA